MSNGRKKLLVFDPYAGGHHGKYVWYLLEHLAAINWPIDVVAALPRPMTAVNPAFEMLAEDSDGALSIHHLQDQDGPRGSVSLAAIDITSGLRVARLARQYGIDAALVMYMDHLQLSLASILRPNRSMAIAGILFRPTLHYGSLPDDRSREYARSTSAQRKRRILATALKNRNLTDVFSLDAFAVSEISKLASPRTAVHWLPDPVDSIRSPRRNRDTQPRTVVLPGAISKRKGVISFLRSLVDVDPGIFDKLRFSIVGPIEPSEKGAIMAELNRVNAQTPRPVTVIDKKMDEQEFLGRVSEADVVALPYIDHIGSSNVLVHAAAAGIPVVGPEFGTLGENIRRYQLGKIVDTRDPMELSRVWEQIAADDSAPAIDRDRAASFAAANSSDAYSQCLSEALLRHLVEGRRG